MERIALPPGSFVDKQLRLQIDPETSKSFLLTNGSHMAMGLASLANIQAALSSTSTEKTLIVAIVSQPVIFHNGLPYALEGDYLTGLLSGDMLSVMERRLVALIQRMDEAPDTASGGKGTTLALSDAFPRCIRLAFPTGLDTDSDPPMKFLDQLAAILSNPEKKNIFFLGDADAPGPLSVVLAASKIMLAQNLSLDLFFLQDSHPEKMQNCFQPEQTKKQIRESPSSKQENSSNANDKRSINHVNFERISILVGSIPNGMTAKLCVDAIFADICFKDNSSPIRTPAERILHHYSLGNLDAAATWLGRYASLILFAHWRSQKCHTDSFLAWASSTMPDLVFGQLQAFSKRPASWWLFRPLPSPRSIQDHNEEEKHLPLEGTPNAANRIRSGLPLILHSSALIMKRDADTQQICRMDINVGDGLFCKRSCTKRASNTEGESKSSDQATVSLISIGQTNMKHQKELIQELQNTIGGGSCRSILWLNLRGEPYVYIGEETTWSLRDQATANRHLRAFAGVPALRLEEIEDRIADDLQQLLKASATHENFFFFEEDSDMIPSAWPQGVVRSPATAFAEIQAHASIELNRKRIPFPGDTKPALAHITTILNAIGGFFETGGRTIVVQCRSGRQGSRSAFCMTLFLVLLACEGAEETHPMPTGADEDSKIVALVQAAPHGRAAWRLVNSLVTKKLNGDHFSRTALHAMRRIPRRHGVVISRLFLLILMASFILDERPQLCKMLGDHFEKWLSSHPEILRMYAMQLPSTAERLAMHASTMPGVCISALTSKLDTSLMGAEHIIKDAHFLGCHVLHQAALQIPGAPNFRIKTWCGRILVGTGIPSLLALPDMARSITAATDGAPGHTLRLLWVNLLEEPVLYLGPGPFSLVRTDRPFDNIVTTGITTRDVERIENDLVALVREEVHHRQDVPVVNDRIKEDDCESVVVHGSFENDDSDVALHSYRLTLSDPEEVRTPRQALSAIDGIDEVVYCRIPISDEQTPLPHAFDELATVLHGFWSNSRDVGMSSKNGDITNGGNDTIDFALFHCQMGRGRTTTCLVLCALLLLKHEDASLSTIFPEGRHMAPTTIKSSIVEIDGVFAPIRGLVDMLENGTTARRIVDAVIDSFADVQNLRQVIPKLSAKLTLQAQYLERYFYLICFGHYLFFDYPCDQKTHFMSFFGTWLSNRPHIAALARRIRPKDH